MTQPQNEDSNDRIGRQAIAHIDRVMEEFMDGYVVVGFVAGSNIPVVYSSVKDGKTLLGVRKLLEMAQVIVSIQND